MVIARGGAGTDVEATQARRQVVLRLGRGESAEEVRADAEVAAARGAWVLDRTDARAPVAVVAPVVDLAAWRLRRRRS